MPSDSSFSTHHSPLPTTQKPIIIVGGGITGLSAAWELQGQGVVASSGDYERSFIRNGRRLHHVLDPRTGWPTQGVHGVALRADRIEDVNGWGAALMVHGNAALAEFSARNAGIDVMAGLSDGSHWLSAGMELRLQRMPATSAA